MESKNFDPKSHITQIKGKDYLEVKWRLVWMRQEHPEWGIETEIVDRVNGGAIVKATIKDGDRVLAQAHKMEQKDNFGDYLEKAETGSIGRALAMCGYGTQFTGDELDEGERVVDAPVENENKNEFRPATTGQQRAIFAILKNDPEKWGMGGTDSLKFLSEHFAKSLQSYKDISFEQASAFIDKYGDKSKLQPKEENVPF